MIQNNYSGRPSKDTIAMHIEKAWSPQSMARIDNQDE